MAVNTEALDIAVRRFPMLVDSFRLMPTAIVSWDYERVERWRLQIIAEYRHVLAKEMRPLANS